MVLQAKKLMEDLINSSSLVQLPGTARVQIVDTLMTMLAQELVWKSLSPEGAAEAQLPYMVALTIQRTT